MVISLYKICMSPKCPPDSTPDDQNSQADISHTNSLQDDMGRLLDNPMYSDCIIRVGDKSFHVNKSILAVRSEYFRALLFGGMKESLEGEVEIKECNPTMFEELLKYTYTGSIHLSSDKTLELGDLLTLADRFGFLALRDSISEFLQSVLTIENVFPILEVSILYDLEELKSSCLSVIDRQSWKVVELEELNLLSKDTLICVLSRHSFYCPEIEIFKAVFRWHRANGLQEPDSGLIKCIRLPLLSVEQLLYDVKDSNLLDSGIILDLIRLRHEQCPAAGSGTVDIDNETTGRMENTASFGNFSYRGLLVPEENIATAKHGAQVVEGDFGQTIIDGDTTNYDLEKGYARHAIGSSNGIVIELGFPSIINHIDMLLWDQDNRSYSYYIQVSMDMVNWITIVDHRRYHCRSWQCLGFPCVVAKFVKIFGTYNTVNKVFHLVSTSIYFTHKQLDIWNGLIVPKENVATKEHAVVISGICRARNSLINGDYSAYDWDSGYTCHQLNNGSIVVQLSQPYMVDSMRLLLWDCDDRTYAYYIEVSSEGSSWELVVDNREKNCRSWQILTFSLRPVVFIRIVGTRNSANEVFHCVHLECPCDKRVLDEFKIALDTSS